MAATAYADIIGTKEGLSEALQLIVNETNKFSGSLSTVPVWNTLHEWQEDAIAAAADNKAVEAHVFADDAYVPTVRLGNYTQIMKKVINVSGTAQAASIAGRADNELVRERRNRLKELARDLEYACVATHNPRVAGSTSTAGEFGNYATWMSANISVGATGSAPTGDGTDAPDAGTARAFTESLLTEVLDSMYNKGADLQSGSYKILAQPAQIEALRGFTGIANDVNTGAQEAAIYNAVSVYVSQYGRLMVEPEVQVKSTDVLIYTPDNWAIGEYRPLEVKEVPAVADSTRFSMVRELTLINRNRNGSGLITDLT